MKKKNLLVGFTCVLGAAAATFISLFVWKSVTNANIVIPEKETIYSINFDGENCKAVGGDVTVPNYSFQTTRNDKDTNDFVITLSVDEGCTLPDPSGVEILFDNIKGQDGDYTYDKDNGKITIIKKANVLIKASAIEPVPIKTYTVTWLNCDGTPVSTERINEGLPPKKPSNPKFQSSPFIEYTFDDWLPAISKEVHSNETYVAKYQIRSYKDTEAYMHVNIVDNNKDFAFTYESTSSSVTIDWGDNTSDLVSNGEASHTYTKSGEYNIRVLNPITTSSVSSDDKTLIEELYLGKGITSIGEAAFKECSNLKTVTFEDGSQLTSIGESAFENCFALTTINIPSGVTSIDGLAFCGCSALTAINIPSGVTSIDDWVFYGCSALTAINIHSGVTKIGQYTFASCSNLKTVTIEGGSQLTTIGEDAFYSCAFSSIVIPSGVTFIGDAAFLDCSNLKIVDLTALDTTPTLQRHSGYDSTAFDYCHADLGLYVKTNKVDDFRSSWAEYAQRITDNPIPSGII